MEGGTEEVFWCRIGDVKRREGVACYVYVCASGGNYALGQHERVSETGGSS